MNISARNQFEGKVTAIDIAQVAAKVKIEVTAPVTVTAVISAEAADMLDIKPGDEIEVVINTTEVMVAKE